MVKGQPTDKPSEQVCLGRITGVHGVRGLVTVQPFTQNPVDITAYGPVQTGSGRQLELTIKSTKKNGLIVAVSGVTSREAAAELRGEDIYTARDRLPRTGAEEWYRSDLVGLAAEDRAGEKLGTVIAVENFGAGDLLEVARQSGESVYLPFTREVVPQVDIPGGRVVLDPPEGSFDVANSDDGDGEPGKTP